MIILGLNSLKNLHLSTTTNNYQGEDGFEKIKIVVSEQISEHNAKDCNFECYVYDVDENGKEIFNNCIPFELTDDCRNANGNYCYEFDLDARYTTATKLGFYLHIYYRQNSLGKTNEVTTSILKHKSSDIGLNEGSIGLFEKYKSDMQKIIQNSASDISQNVLQKINAEKRRVWFKKNCPNWTTPRIYLFTNTGMSNSSAPNLNLNGRTKENIWDFADSPYMIQDETEEDLYYYDIPLQQYRNIIFFCDERDSSGWNYKTSDLVIPQGYLYDNLYYWQSPIGYDGVWADKETNNFKLFIQIDDYWDILRSLCIKVNDIDVPIYKLGKQGCGGDSVGHSYYYIDVPLIASNVYINMSIGEHIGNGQYKNKTIERTFSIHQLCFNCSGLYEIKESYSVGLTVYTKYEIYNYDISLDEVFMFQTRYTASEYQLYRDAYKYFDINNMQQSLNNIRKELPTTSGTTYGTMGDIKFYYDYYKIGKIVYLSCSANFFPTNCDVSKHNIKIGLPYSMNASDIGKPISFGTGYLKYYSIDNDKQYSTVNFDIEGISSTSMKPDIQDWSNIYSDLNKTKSIYLCFRVLYLSS